MLSPFEPTCNRSAGDLDDSLTNVRKKICYNYITQFWCWNDFSPFSATLTFFLARDLGKAAVGRDITTFTETFLKVNINLMAVGKRKKKRRFLVVTAKNRLETVFSPNKKPF